MRDDNLQDNPRPRLGFRADNWDNRGMFSAATLEQTHD